MYQKNKKPQKSTLSDTKLKPLSPTLRQRKRFVKAQIISQKKFDFKEISESLIEEIILYMGAIDLGKSGIWLLRDKFDYENQIIIMKVGTKYKDKLIGVLSLVNNVSSIKTKIETLKVSSTLKGLQEKTNS